MKTTQFISLQLDCMTTPSQADLVGATQNPPAARKAVIGGGGCVTPTVAAHVRRKAADADLHTLENRTSQTKASIGGGGCVTPAVAAHLRKCMARKGPHSI